MKQLLVCTPKRLPKELLIPAAQTAVKINPLNHPPLHRLTRVPARFPAHSGTYSGSNNQILGNPGGTADCGIHGQPSG